MVMQSRLYTGLSQDASPTSLQNVTRCLRIVRGHFGSECEVDTEYTLAVTPVTVKFGSEKGAALNVA